MIKSFRLMHLLTQMLEYQQKAACMPSFKGLQKDILGISPTINQLNMTNAKDHDSKSVNTD